MSPTATKSSARAWQLRGKREGGTVTGLALSPTFAKDQTVFAATMAGVYRSSDAGKSWRPANTGLTSPFTICVALSPRFEDDGGTLAMFSITTPFGDTTFRFLERRGYRMFYPGMQPHPTPRGGKNAFGFKRIDHLTSNFQTMKPALLWPVSRRDRHASTADEAAAASAQAAPMGLRLVVMSKNSCVNKVEAAATEHRLPR